MALITAEQDKYEVKEVIGKDTPASSISKLIIPRPRRLWHHTESPTEAGWSCKPIDYQLAEWTGH